MISALKQDSPFDECVYVRQLEQTNQNSIESDPQIDLHWLHKLECDYNDINMCKNVLPIIVDPAGYCCFAMVKKNCNDCKNMIIYTDFPAQLHCKYMNGVVQEVNVRMLGTGTTNSTIIFPS